MNRTLPAHNSGQGGESSENMVSGSAVHRRGEHGHGGLFRQYDEYQPDGVPDDDDRRADKQPDGNDGSDSRAFSGGDC